MSRPPPARTTVPPPIETLSFESPAAFRTWLAKQHRESPGVWLRIFKKDSGIATVSYAAALDEALCYGWIDGQKRSVDAHSYLQKFTPRRPGSGWSKRNTEHVERLITAGRLTLAGFEQVNAARVDGRWHSAYDAFGAATVPVDFLDAVARNRKAKDFFETLNKTNLYSIVYRLQTAKKPETRAKRMHDIIECLARGEKFH